MAKNTALYFSSKAIDTVAAIAVLALITRYLGPDSYGKFAFIMNLIFIFIPIIHFGLGEIIIREMAKNKENAGELFGAAMTIRMGIVLLSAVSVFAISYQFRLSPMLMTAVGLGMISEFALAYGRLNSDVFIAYEKMGYDTLIVVVNRLPLILAIALAAYYDLGLTGIFICLAGVNFLTTVFAFCISMKRFIKPRITYRLEPFKFIIKAAFPIALAMFLFDFSIRLDIFFLKAFKNFSEIALFGAPMRLVLRLSTISVAFVTSLYPLYSRLADSCRSDLHYLYEKSFKALFAFIFPVCIFTTFFAQRIVVLIFGAEFIQAAASLHLLIWMLFFLFMSILCGHILISLGEQKLITVGQMVCLIANLILDVVLIPPYGYVGASCAKFIAFGILFLFSCYLVSSRLGSISIRNIIIKPMVASLLMILSLYLAKDHNLLLIILLGSLVYVGGLVVLKIFSHGEVTKLKEVLKAA